MKKFNLVLSLLVALTSLNVFAGADRIIDAKYITNGSATITVPTTTDALVGLATSDVLTNKSISGSTNTLSNISMGSLTGTLGVSNGGSGAASFTLNGILFGNGTSAFGVTALGTQYQVLQAGVAGLPAFGALALGQSAAVSGQLGVANGGTGASTLAAHGVLLGNGTSAVSVSGAGTSGQVLMSNGASADPTFQTIPTASPSLNGSVGSAQSVTAAGGVVLSSIGYQNFVWVAGNAGAVTVTATPSITNGTAVGQKLTVFGTSGTNKVTLQDEANLASSTLRLNGNWVGAAYSALELVWDGASWVEVARR